MNRVQNSQAELAEMLEHVDIDPADAERIVETIRDLVDAMIGQAIVDFRRELRDRGE